MKYVKSGLIIFLTFLLFSCNSNVTSPETDKKNEIGKIEFSIDMSSAPAEVVNIIGILSREGFDSIPFNFYYDDTTNYASVQIENIPVGSWNLRVDAFNIDSVVIYTGSMNVIVESATTTNVNLYLSPTSGSIRINVQWGERKTISDLDDFLIGYWDFDDNSMRDLSLFKNNGRVFGNTSFTKGKKGNAINFNGYADYAEIPNNSVYSRDEKSISFWLYKNNDFILESEGKSDGEAVLTKSYDTGINRDYIILISANNPRFHIYGSIGTDTDTIIVSGKTQAISPQTWYHCVFVVGNDYTEFYLNGKRTEQSYKPGSSINTTAPILLGKFTDNSLPTRYFNGKIDELRIYNKALSSDEVQLLYNDAL